MNAFESLIAMLLKRDGYWTATSVKVELTKAEKRRIGKPTTPRWEIDVIAYRGSTNELLAVECKSFLDSPGVTFHNGKFEPERRYKLFTETTTRRVVLARLKKQLVASGACGPNPTVTLGLAAGNIAKKTDRVALRRHFDRKKWKLLDERWIYEQLEHAASGGYEDDVAHLVSKLIFRRGVTGANA